MILILLDSVDEEERGFQVKNSNWITDILVDVAWFAEENDLPKTYELLIKAIKVAEIEAKRNRETLEKPNSNVVLLFDNKIESFAVSSSNLVCD